METFEEYFTEMALADSQKIGKWDDKKNRHGYDKASVGILNSPKGWEKIQQTFDRINMADFNLYFVKDVNAWKHRETGKQSPQDVNKKLNFDPSQQEKYDPEAITVVFTNNAAAEKVPLTPWTIAHRMGHTFIRSYRQGYLNRDAEFEFRLGKVESAVNSILRNAYGANEVGGGSNVMGTPLHRNLFESIGTMRSARMKKLSRPYEFISECFAQFLLSNGQLKFNNAPAFLSDSNKKAWGNPTGRNYRLKVDQEQANGMIDNLSGAMSNLFYYWVESHKGTTSIM
jgi:hypothetical protein